MEGKVGSNKVAIVKHHVLFKNKNKLKINFRHSDNIAISNMFWVTILM
jgi:hypothetical protein